MSKYVALFVFSVLFFTIGCQQEKAPLIVQGQFPRVDATALSCAEESSYLSAIESGRYGLVIGNVVGISPELDLVTLDDGDDPFHSTKCGGPIYPSINVELKNVRTSWGAGQDERATVSFNSELVERWTPQPIVMESTRLRWLSHDKKIFDSKIDEDVRIALLVARDPDSRLVAYEGWLAEVLPDGSAHMVYMDECEVPGAEESERQLLAAAKKVSPVDGLLRVSEIPPEYLYSTCGLE